MAALNGPHGYISLSEAGRLTGYSAEYLRLLCVSGQIDACKVGRMWVISEAAIPKLAHKVTPPELSPSASVPKLPWFRKPALWIVGLVLAWPVAVEVIGLDDFARAGASQLRESLVERTDDLKTALGRKAQGFLLGVLEGDFGGNGIRSRIAGESLASPLLPQGDVPELPPKPVLAERTVTEKTAAPPIPLQPVVLGISNDEIIAAFRATLAEGLPADILVQFKGERGEKGDKGDSGENGVTVSYTLPTSTNTSSIGSIAGVTHLGVQDLSAQTLSVSSTATFSALTVTGNLTIPNSSITFASWTSNSCAANQIPKFNGTIWACAADSAGDLDAQYLTLAASLSLTNERILTGTANQIILTDNGAGSNLTLSLPQNIHTGATPTFAGLTAATIYGGTGASSTLTLAGTSNGAPSNAHIILNASGQGNVGIGTTGPNTLLDVNGAITLRGDITRETSDASDTGRIQIAGGGSASNTRGGYIAVHGNEHASLPGKVSIVAGHVSGGIIGFETEAAERWQIRDGAGHLVAVTDQVIRRNTSDASDNGSIAITGGGDWPGPGDPAPTKRGAWAAFYGNEHASYAGDIQMYLGNGTNANFSLVDKAAGFYIFDINGSDGSATFTSSKAGVNTWTFNNTDTNGGAIYFQRSGTNKGAIGAATAISGTNGTSDDLAVGGAGALILVSTTTNQVNPGQNTIISLGSSARLWKDVWASNGTIQTSDSRLKTDILDSDLGLDFIKALRPVSYRWIDKDNGTHYGLVAQEVQPIAPNNSNFVIDTGDGSYLGMNYAEYTAPLIKAIQELDTELQNHESRLASLSLRIEELEQSLTVAQSGDGQLLPAESGFDLAGFSLLNVKAVTSISGKWSIDDNGVMIAHSVKAEFVEGAKGFTTFDQITGEPYCIQVRNGASITLPGRCDELAVASPSPQESPPATVEVTDSETAESAPSESTGVETESAPADSPEVTSTEQVLTAP